MESIEAIKYMINKRGSSARAVSIRLDRAPTFLGSSFSHGSTPRIDTMANIAEILGYKLVLKDNTEEIELTPTKKEKADNE